MSSKRLREKQKIRSKPSNREMLNLVEHDKRLKTKRASKAKEAIYMRILGGVMMAFTIYIWYWRGYVIPMSSLTIIGGIIVAGIFKVVFPAVIDAEKNARYFLGFLVMGAILSLIVNQTVFGLATMFLFSLISALFLFGVIKSFPDSKTQS